MLNTRHFRKYEQKNEKNRKLLKSINNSNS